jgi:hypothetical protein
LNIVYSDKAFFTIKLPTWLGKLFIRETYQ